MTKTARYRKKLIRYLESTGRRVDKSKSVGLGLADQPEPMNRTYAKSVLFTSTWKYFLRANPTATKQGWKADCKERKLINSRHVWDLARQRRLLADWDYKIPERMNTTAPTMPPHNTLTAVGSPISIKDIEMAMSKYNMDTADLQSLRLTSISVRLPLRGKTIE